MPTTPTTPAPLTLWLTDRSRFKLGTGRCARARYLSYHFGPTGYGITMKREALPLATGLSVHEGTEQFCQVLLKEHRLPTLDETRVVIASVRATYEAKVTTRGYRGILSSEQTEETIKEQSALISGLLWAVRLKFLTWLVERYTVVAVEREHMHFLDCTCGAPPLDAEEHIRRGCTGKVLMQRIDILAQQKNGQNFAYLEIKTTGFDSASWAEQWETDPQLALGTLDVSKIYGGEVTELYIVGLSKGSRKRDRYEDDGRRRQLSPLCYGYCRPGNPPLMKDDWLPSYEWTTDDGTTKRKSKAHRRRGVWELTESDWPAWTAYRHQDPAMSAEEFWVRFLPHSVLDKTCFLLGPMNRQDEQLASLRRSLVAEETRWQQTLWTLYELQQQGHSWASETFQHALDAHVPCSWQCRPFGKDTQCEMVGICHRHQGWDDPLANGYQPRLPHHAPEQLQAVARGLLPDEAAESEHEEE
jgi:hypothetical protein